MRKSSLLLLCIIFFALSCTSITGSEELTWQNLKPDESILSEGQKDITHHNATLLAFREMYAQDPTFIEINDGLIDGYYKALATILTSKAGQQHEVIQNLAIFDQRNLYGLLVEPNEDAPFLDNWSDSVITTGIAEIDTLLAGKGFEIASIHDWSFSENIYFVLETSTALNTLHISDLLDQTGYFTSAGINAICCDGSDIDVKKHSSSAEFTFINAYGDCPAGCINHDKYIFTLNNNGHVEFIGTN